MKIEKTIDGKNVKVTLDDEKIKKLELEYKPIIKKLEKDLEDCVASIEVDGENIDLDLYKEPKIDPSKFVLANGLTWSNDTEIDITTDDLRKIFANTFNSIDEVVTGNLNLGLTGGNNDKKIQI